MKKLQTVAEKYNLPVEKIKYELEKKIGRKKAEKIEKGTKYSIAINDEEYEDEPEDIDKIHMLIEWDDYDKEEHPNYKYAIGEIIEIEFFIYQWYI